MSDPNRYLVIDVTAPRATRRTLRARTQPLLLSLRRSAGDQIRKQAWSEPLEHADRSGSVQSRGIIILVSGVQVPPPLPNFIFIISHLHHISRRTSRSLAGPGYHFGYQSAPHGCETVPA